MLLHNEMPTSTLLSVKIGDVVSNHSSSGIIQEIQISETEEYLQFVFTLSTLEEIVIRKLKQVC